MSDIRRGSRMFLKGGVAIYKKNMTSWGSGGRCKPPSSVQSLEARYDSAIFA